MYLPWIGHNIAVQGNKLMLHLRGDQGSGRDLVKGLHAAMRSADIQPRVLAIFRRYKFKLTALGVLVMMSLAWNASAYKAGRGLQARGAKGRGNNGLFGSLRIRYAKRPLPVALQSSLLCNTAMVKSWQLQLLPTAALTQG
jgi:hypothetical protein